MNRTAVIFLCGALALLGCSGDDEDVPEAMACSSGTDAGEMVECSCGDASMGMAVCQEDGQLGACDCMSSGGSGGAGGTAGGTDGAVGGMGGSGGMAGSGGSDPDDDGGTDPIEDDASVELPPLPDDGNQSAVCDDGTDCNQGLDCYNPGTEGQGYCSAVCEGDEDCESLSDATYVCSMSTSVCVVECEGEDDEESCPAPMVCVNATGFGGGGGEVDAYRCKYPDAPTAPGTAQAFEQCSMDERCVDGLVCGGGFGGSGYCTLECEAPDGDCSGIADVAGDLTLECSMGFGGPGGGAGRCTLDCSENEDGCPEGMACVQMGPMAQRCAYE